MTCIAAAHKNGRTFIGCDSLVSSGDTRATQIIKIIDFPGAKVGFAGSLLGFHVLENMGKAKRAKSTRITSVESARDFAKRFFYSLKREFSFMENENMELHHSNLLIATPGKLYVIDAATTCITYDDYTAIGSGESSATPVLRALWDVMDDPQAIVHKSLESACHFNVYCGEPIHIFEVEAAPAVKKTTKKKKPVARKIES